MPAHSHHRPGHPPQTRQTRRNRPRARSLDSAEEASFPLRKGGTAKTIITAPHRRAITHPRIPLIAPSMYNGSEQLTVTSNNTTTTASSTQSHRRSARSTPADGPSTTISPPRVPSDQTFEQEAQPNSNLPPAVFTPLKEKEAERQPWLIYSPLLRKFSACSF